jgi:hypothetical protein
MSNNNDSKYNMFVYQYAAREFNKVLKAVRRIKNGHNVTIDEGCKAEDVKPELFRALMDVMLDNYVVDTDLIDSKSFVHMVTEGILTNSSLAKIRKETKYTNLNDFHTKMTFEEFTKLPATNKTKIILVEQMIKNHVHFKDYDTQDKMKQLLDILKAFNNN